MKKCFFPRAAYAFQTSIIPLLRGSSANITGYSIGMHHARKITVNRIDLRQRILVVCAETTTVNLAERNPLTKYCNIAKKWDGIPVIEDTFFPPCSYCQRVLTNPVQPITALCTLHRAYLIHWWLKEHYTTTTINSLALNTNTIGRQLASHEQIIKNIRTRWGSTGQEITKV